MGITQFKFIRTATWCLLLHSPLALAGTLNDFAAPNEAEILTQKLTEFDKNPQVFMKSQKNIQKYNPETGEALAVSTVFTEESIASGDFILQKDFFQKSSKLFVNEGKAPIYNNDNPANLVDQLSLTSLKAMDRPEYRSSRLDASPWSDDYWPIYTGVIAKRYADSNFPYSKNWNVNRSYILNSSCSVDTLSPAEKYDLLVGDSSWTLTRAMANNGAQYGGGYVQTWMGICHGWAPASFMMPRPSQAVTVLAADGKTQIRFYPSDVKALASLLWANASPGVRFLSGRCQIKNPAEDRNGRVVDQSCFDTNPGTWHTAIVNQIAVSRRSFVLDATYDYEVWNQPIVGYRYNYFNPQSFTAANSFEQALVPVRSFTRDKFRAYRSNRAAYVVGISMRLVYVKETNPSHALKDHDGLDNRVAVDYLYDLELDSSYNIVGGEWYQRGHPDFLWVPAPTARALTIADRNLMRRNLSWNGKEAFPSSWTSSAASASASGQPLGLVVESLIGLSQ